MIAVACTHAHHISSWNVFLGPAVFVTVVLGLLVGLEIDWRRKHRD